MAHLPKRGEEESLQAYVKRLGYEAREGESLQDYIKRERSGRTLGPRTGPAEAPEWMVEAFEKIGPAFKILALLAVPVGIVYVLVHLSFKHR
jgi:hypothetical protein